jgi:hypothetical protein
MTMNDDMFFSLNKDKEIGDFSIANKDILSLILELNDLSDSFFNKSVSSDRKGLTIFVLGRLCSRHFENILWLAPAGYGFAASRILRSMFEKFIDATYLHKHPHLIDEFWDYGLVEIHNLEGEKAAEEFNPDFRTIIAKFENPKPKKGYRYKWSKKSIREKARAVGIFKDKTLKHAYSYPNLFVHTSTTEISLSLILEEDGSISPVEPHNNEAERRIARLTLIFGIEILLRVMDTLDEHYAFGYGERLNDFAKKFASIVNK